MRRNFGLDALRAAAVLIVLANHAARGLFEWTDQLQWGDRWVWASLAANISIEWLFVLSGFLIGAMMIRTFEEDGTSWWRIRSFWLRRWFRTMPNYYLFLGINAALAVWAVSPGQATWWHVFFSQNLAWQKAPGYYPEAWTLAADEWFYLVAPLLVVAVAWLRRDVRAGFLGATALLIVIPMAARLLHDVPIADDTGDRLRHWDYDIRTVTLYHLDATGWGVLGAVVSRWFPKAWSNHRGAKAIAGLLMMVAGIYLIEELYWGGPVWLLAPRLAGVAILLLPAAGTFLALPWIASLRPQGGFVGASVGWISLYSYTIYLAHLPALFLLRHLLEPSTLLATWAVTALWLVVVALFSMLVFHGFEKPLSDLRERFTRRVDANPFQANEPATNRPAKATTTESASLTQSNPAAPTSPPGEEPRPLRQSVASWSTQAKQWLLERRPAGTRADLLVVIVAAIVVGWRWTVRAASIQSWDGATFALATERYDMNALRPHAPGYPLFVLLAKLAKPLVGGDANDALILVALASTILAVALAYWLGRTLLHRAAGLAAATLLAASPVVFVHSVTANVYTADLACSAAVATLAWRAHHDPSRRHLLQLAVGLALCLGIRPSQAFFLAPVAAWGALRPPWTLREQSRRLVLPIVAGAAVCLAWFVPMVRLSGGLAKWRAATGEQSNDIVFGNTVLEGGLSVAAENLERLGGYGALEIRWVVSVVAVLAALGLFVAVLQRQRAPAGWSPAAWPFLAVWLLPGLLFYVLVFGGWGNGPSGYLLVILLPMLLAVILVAELALRQVHMVSAPAVVAVLACVCLAVSTTGLAIHRYESEDVGYRDHDAWAAGWAGLRDSFPPGNTTIVALWNFAYAWWTFPEYTVYNYRAPGHGPGQVPGFLMVQVARDHEARPDWYDAMLAGPNDATHPLDPSTQALVLFDFQLAGENGGVRQVRPEVPVREAFLPNGWRVLVIDVTPDRLLLEDYFTPAPDRTE